MRCEGALGDFGRSMDHLTRSVRTDVKQIEAAAAKLNGSATEQLIAERTGLTPARIRQVQALEATRPVPIEDSLGDDSAVGFAMAVKTPSTESQATVNSLLGDLVTAIRGLGWPACELLALVYFHDLKVPDAAAVLGIGAELASEVHRQALLGLHNVMVSHVTGGRVAAPVAVSLTRAVSDSDRCRATDRAGQHHGRAYSPRLVPVSSPLPGCDGGNHASGEHPSSTEPPPSAQPEAPPRSTGSASPWAWGS